MFSIPTPMLYLAMAESVNKFQITGPAWFAHAIGKLCSIMKSEAGMALRSLFPMKNYVTIKDA